MIDQTVISAAIGSAITTIVVAIGYMMRTRTDTHANEVAARGEVAKTEANSDATLVSAILKLAEGMNENNKTAGLERQQTLMAIERSGGRTEGMMAAIVDQTKSVNSMSLQIDEFGGRLQHLPQIKSGVDEIKAATASIETNLGESFSEQFIPVVNALRAVEIAVRDLTKELEDRDSLTSQGLVKLTGLFYEAKLEFMRRISPDVEKHIDEFLTPDLPDNTNGKSTNVQELPVNIQITSAKESKS